MEWIWSGLRIVGSGFVVGKGRGRDKWVRVELDYRGF